MCGIFGIVTNKNRPDLIEPVKHATRALAHRGPDDEGIEFLRNGNDGLTVAFAHRRLSILDLSPAGHQPMRDEITGNWITYNGEVFNFREVRGRLISQGLNFHSESDTEVVLKGYGLFGNRAIADWRGMFAFGVWNEREHSLTLVRDRLGIKPLYYYYDGESFIFASELRALLATGLVPKRMSQVALDSYFAFGSVQQPLTIIENVYALLPGHSLTFKEGRINTLPYWELHADGYHPVTNQQALVAEIRELLLESVRLRMVSDVPVGVFLSGGIDSSAVVALMRQATTNEIRSFSICFKEQEFNEQIYAERVAQSYETCHQSVFISENEALSKLPSAMNAMDQPSIDGFNTYLISEAVAQSGLKVALSGLGGDEVFAGYSFYQTIFRDEWLREQVKNIPQGIRKMAAVALNSVASTQRSIKLGSILSDDQLCEPVVQLHRQLFSKHQRHKLLGQGIANSEDRTKLDNWTEHRFENTFDTDPLNRASALELGGYLSNTLLRDTDSMSMAHNLEVRVPLIDHKIIERSLLVPGALKLQNKKPKWLLVDAVKDLPSEIIYRRKRGFELPFKVWLSSVLRPQIESVIESASSLHIFDKHSAQSVWNDFLTGRTSWARAWSLYVVSEWSALNL